MRRRGEWEFYPPSRPRPVVGGIKARSKRGRIGETWWSGRWLAFLESLGVGARLGRGRAYARAGQVMSLKVERGLVSARVQGSRPRPYTVTIRLAPLPQGQWEKAIAAMASQALFAARLLAGEMPQNIEEAFQSARVSLFPTKRRDLESDCSCPDWANPCKHVAAVYYLLAEEFDRDPFLVFRLRGMEKEDLVAALRELRAGGAEGQASASQGAPASDKVEEDAPPLEACLHCFWSAGPELASFRVTVAPPAVPLAILKRLGAPSFLKNGGDLLQALERVYGAASDQAMRLAYGQEERSGSE